MLNLAAADALISCWNDKSFWHFWRPLTAIQNGDDDTNPATDGDIGMAPVHQQPELPGPSLGLQLRHERDDAHGGELLRHEQVRVPDHPEPDLRTPTFRDYTRFTDVVKDTIDARVYQGIHFRSADVQGAEHR